MSSTKPWVHREYLDAISGVYTARPRERAMSQDARRYLTRVPASQAISALRDWSGGGCGRRHPLVFGATLTPANHGALGQLARSSPTLLDAALRCSLLAHSRTNCVACRWRLGRQYVSLTLSAPELSPADAAVILPVVVGAMLAQFFAATGKALCATVFLPGIAMPPRSAPLAESLQQVRLVKSADEVRITVRKQALVSWRNPEYSAWSQHFWERFCEHEAIVHNVTPDVLRFIKDLINRTARRPPSLAHIGDHLGMSARTLARRLQESGTNYRELVLDARR